jgi:CheY-like chemotaxis protein
MKWGSIELVAIVGEQVRRAGTVVVVDDDEALRNAARRALRLEDYDVELAGDGMVAVVSIVATLRWLWQHQNPRRWQYLPLALRLTALIALFLVNDTRVLYA